MNERYTRLFSLPQNLYAEGSPVLIAAGALLRDNQTGGVLAQLKFQSLSERRIQAVKVALRASDVTGAELEGVPEQQYLDLDAARGDSFGQKTAISLPSAVTRSFSCACSSVVFADGSVWTAPEGAVWEPMKQPSTLQDALGDLAEQYRRDTFAGAQYAPTDDRDLWVCACGTVNRRSETQCVHCGSERDALFAAADATRLRERAQEFAAQQAKEAAEREAAAEKEAAEEKERMAVVKSGSSSPVPLPPCSLPESSC